MKALMLALALVGCEPPIKPILIVPPCDQGRVFHADGDTQPLTCLKVLT